PLVRGRGRGRPAAPPPPQAPAGRRSALAAKVTVGSNWRSRRSRDMRLSLPERGEVYGPVYTNHSWEGTLQFRNHEGHEGFHEDPRRQGTKASAQLCGLRADVAPTAPCEKEGAKCKTHSV